MKRELANGKIVDIPQSEIDELNNQNEVQAERQLRLNKIAEIKAERLRRIQGILPAIETEAELEMLRGLVQAFQLSNSGTLAKTVYQYGQTKVKQAKTAPIDLVQAYDPTTDDNWPAD